MKTCTKCNETKQLDEFFKRVITPSGRESICKVCRKAHNKAWLSNNKDRHKELTRKWYEENKETHLENSKKRYEADKSKALEKYYARELRTKQAMPLWADRTEIARIFRDAKKVTIETGIKYEVDHIVPITGKTVCGLHTPHNLQIITATENKRKYNTTWQDMP